MVQALCKALKSLVPKLTKKAGEVGDVAGIIAKNTDNVTSSNPIKTIQKIFDTQQGAIGDTVELTAKKRWTGPIEDFIPTTFKGSDVSMHHWINGDNSDFRDFIKAARKFEPSEITSKRQLKDWVAEDIRNIDIEFSKLKPLEKDCIVFRGRNSHPFIARWNTDFEIIKNAKVGDVIIPDEGYSYCAFEHGLASNWSYNSGTESIMYEILLPKGAKVSRNLEHGGEVVMPRGAEYIVKHIKNNGEGHTFVTLEYLLPKKDNVAEIESLMRKHNIPISEG